VPACAVKLTGRLRTISRTADRLGVLVANFRPDKTNFLGLLDPEDAERRGTHGFVPLSMDLDA
jgi:hypothetical protein